MSKRREQEQAQSQHEQQDLGRTLHKVYAALYNNVPWLAVAAICMYLPGIVLWAVFALHCKADTFKFLTTIAPVDDSTVDGVSNLVNTTLIALITTATFIFMLALVLAIARSLQKAGAAPNSSFPCVRNSPSSFYLYRVFNLGYNFIVFFVNMFIVFLMMGAFLWLVVAYGANLSIKGGVLDAANIGVRPQLQYDLARKNYTTVVSQYEKQLKQTPPCVRNSTWLKGINSSIASILKPPTANNTLAGNVLLCPQSCLNLGSWATLFKLKSACMCEQDKLFLLQKHSMAVATDAGVALGGLILIYFGSCCMHTYLISEHVRAGYDYKRAKRQAARQRQQLNSSINGSDAHRNGPDKGPGGSGSSFAGPPGSGGGGGLPGGSDPDGTAVSSAGHHHHVISLNGMNGTMSHKGLGSSAVLQSDGYYEDGSSGAAAAGSGSLLQQNSAYAQQHRHQRSNSSSSAYDSVAKGAVSSESRGGSFSIVEEGRLVSGTGVAAAAGALAAAAAAAAAAGAGAVSDGSPMGPAAAAGAGPDAVLLQSRLLQQRHHRISSGGGSSSSPVSAVVGRHLQRIPSPHNGSRGAAAFAATAPAAAAAVGAAALQQHQGDSGQGLYPRGSGSRVADWQQQQQQQLGAAHEHVRAISPPAMSGTWSAHGRSESRSSTSSIRDLLSGAVPLDSFGHVQRHGLTPTSSGNAAAAAAALQQQQQLVPVIQEVPSVTSLVVTPGGSSVAAVPAAAGSSSSTIAVGGAQAATHRRGDSQQSNSSSSSSYDTVVCHSPRSSDAENNSSSVGNAAGLHASTAAAAFLPSSGSVTSRAQVSRQAAAAAAADTEVPAAPIPVGAAVDGEEALSGSRTGSWSKKQAHRRLPALDFTTAAPALWLAQEREAQQQQEVQAAALADGHAAAAAAAAMATPVAPSSSLSGPTAGPTAAAAAAASRAVGRVPVRRHIALESECKDTAPAAAAAMPQQQQQQQEFSLDHDVPLPQQQQQGQQQQQQQQHLPSMEAVAAMLRPSPEPNADEQQQQQQAAQMQGMRDVATLEAEQQQRMRQRPAYSLLLPPPEQQELLLKQQQQQLQLLLQQAQEEQQQQQQQVWQQPHQRQWSTSSIPFTVQSGSSGAASPGAAGSSYLRQQHHHSFSTPDPPAAAAAAAAGGAAAAAAGVSPYGMGAGLGLSTPSKYASGSGGIHRGSFGGPSLARAVSAGGGVAPSSVQQQQQQQLGGFLQPGSYSCSSSVSGGVRFPAGTASSLTGEEESSPGDGGGSFSSRAPASAAAAAGAYGAGSSAAGGSAASSMFTTPQATPQSSPAPLRSGRVTPSYAGLNLGAAAAAAVGGSSGGGVASLTGSGSWSQLPPAGHTGSALTNSSSYSGSANAPGFAGGLNNLLLPGGPVVASTPRSVLLSPLGREEVLPLQGAASGFGLLNPVGSSGAGAGTAQGLGYGLLNPASTAPQGSGIPGITPIPEVACAEGVEGDSSGLGGGGGGPMGGVGSSSSAAAAAAGAAGSSSLLGGQQQADVIESPLERRRSGYRSSMRKGLMAYDQYKHRQRYQEAVTQPLDPGSEVARRYRSRMPAI